MCHFGLSAPENRVGDKDLDQVVYFGGILKSGSEGAEGVSSEARTAP